MDEDQDPLRLAQNGHAPLDIKLDPIEVDHLLEYFGSDGPEVIPDPLDIPSATSKDLDTPIAFFDDGVEDIFEDEQPLPNVTLGSAPSAAPGSTQNGPAKSTRGRKPKYVSDSLEKKAALQEKNRRAQKRFRDRQKQRMQSATAQLESLSLELDTMRSELTKTQSKATVLEKVIHLKEDQMRLYQNEVAIFDSVIVPVFPQETQNASKLSSETSLPSVSNDSGQLSTKSGELLDEDLPSAAAGTAVPPAPNGPPAGMPMDPEVVEAVKTMSADDFIKQYKTMVEEVAEFLQIIDNSKAREDPQRDEAIMKMGEALRRSGELTFLTAMFSPSNIHALIAATLDDGASEASVDDKAKWERVAVALNLDEDQQDRLLALKDSFVENLTHVKAERRRLISSLQNVEDSYEVGVPMQRSVNGLFEVASKMAELKEILLKEHNVCTELIGATNRSILTPIQKARIAVESYPFYPDIFEIALAVERRRKGTSDLMA